MRNKKVDDYEDDGRTIVDMSQVERPNLFSIRSLGNDSIDQKQTSDRSSYQEPLTKEQTRWAILGTLKASLLIGLAYVVGLGLLILIMVLWFLK